MIVLGVQGRNCDETLFHWAALTFGRLSPLVMHISGVLSPLVIYAFSFPIEFCSLGVSKGKRRLQPELGGYHVLIMWRGWESTAYQKTMPFK